MKRLITIVITFLILTGLSYGITYYTQTKFIDCSFFIGLAVTVFICFLHQKVGTHLVF
ncbi:hypothetical protein G6549_00560 [Bacillus sp. MM2020_1]|nr:hypothetical protein [Bacillus sp. MM2020_1]